MSVKLSENLIYRANIFNYDTNYFVEFNKANHKINFELFNSTSHRNLSENYNKFNSFSSIAITEQIEKLNSLVGLLVEESEPQDADDVQRKIINKEAKVFVQVTLDLLNSSAKLLKDANDEFRSESTQWEVSVQEKKKRDMENIFTNLLNALLILDAIIMVNVELAAALELLSDNVGVNLINCLYNILEDRMSYFNDYAKEVASHIISCILVFSVKKEYEVSDFKRIMDWVFNYNNSKDKKRDNLLTSNLYIILSNNKGLQCFLEDNGNKPLKEIISIMSKEVSINIVYESIFCVWNIANSPKYIHIFENNTEGVFDKLIQVIKLNKVEKIIRIGALCIKSLLSSEKCIEFLVDYHFNRTVNNLLCNKWSDEIIKDELNYIYDYLEKNHKFVNSFEKYKKEIESGNLKWGYLHRSDFWEDNFREFETQNFEYIRLLSEIIKSPTIKESDIEKKCIACNDLGEFAKYYPGGAGVLALFGVKETLLELIQHENLELKNKALICIQKIMMKSNKK